MVGMIQKNTVKHENILASKKIKKNVHQSKTSRTFFVSFSTTLDFYVFCIKTHAMLEANMHLRCIELNNDK